MRRSRARQRTVLFTSPELGLRTRCGYPNTLPVASNDQRRTPEVPIIFQNKEKKNHSRVQKSTFFAGIISGLRTSPMHLAPKPTCPKKLLGKKKFLSSPIHPLVGCRLKKRFSTFSEGLLLILETTSQHLLEITLAYVIAVRFQRVLLMPIETIFFPLSLRSSGTPPSSRNFSSGTLR